jgi:SAM-dependent methyltransferase
MSDWNKLYGKNRFSIETDKPSEIVRKGLRELQLSPNFRALDLGCGNGRNSIYAAQLEGLVDSVDLVDLGSFENLNPSLKNKISFYEQSVVDFDIVPNSYSAIIATRLIQYINPSELSILISNIEGGLISNGILIINYTSSGGVFTQPEINVPKYQHSIATVSHLLKTSGLKITSLYEGEKTSTHVPYRVPVNTYNILAKKPPQD